MKKLLICLVLLLTACTEKTPYGNCIGAFEEPAPNLNYKVPGMNVAMAIIFFETIIVPMVVIFDQTKCPIGEKSK